MDDRSDKWLAVAEEMTFSTNTTAKGFEEGRKDAIAGKPIDSYKEKAGDDPDFAVGFIKGWMDATINGTGDDALPAALKFWGTEDEALFEEVRNGLRDYGKTIVEFADDAGVSLTEPSLDALVQAFESLEAEYESEGDELAEEDARSAE